MPTVDVDIEDFLFSCTDSEKRKLIKLLGQDGHYTDELVKERIIEVRRSVAEQEFQEHLNALDGKWNLLTSEEEHTIKSIAKRFIP
jgi:hypothetical protein